jgi:Protein of unknown function (DUF3224)
MTKTHALTGSFENTSWDEKSIEEREDGAKLTQAAVTQKFDGDIHGDGAAQWLMSYRSDGTAHFVGLQRVDGTIDGRKGSFVLETLGDFDGKVASWTATVVPGSGTRELDALSGSGSFEAPLGSTAEFAMKVSFD